MTEFFYLIQGYFHSTELICLIIHHDALQSFPTSSKLAYSFVLNRVRVVEYSPAELKSFSAYHKSTNLWLHQCRPQWLYSSTWGICHVNAVSSELRYAILQKLTVITWYNANHPTSIKSIIPFLIRSTSSSSEEWIVGSCLAQSLSFSCMRITDSLLSNFELSTIFIAKNLMLSPHTRFAISYLNYLCLEDVITRFIY